MNRCPKCYCEMTHYPNSSTPYLCPACGHSGTGEVAAAPPAICVRSQSVSTGSPPPDPPAPSDEDAIICEAVEAADTTMADCGCKEPYDVAERALRAQREIDAKVIEQYQRRIAEMQRDRLDLEADEADEVAEFNAGFEAAKAGKTLDDEPSETRFDVWRVGFAWQKFDGLVAEVERLKALLRAALLMGHLPPAIEAKIDAALRPKANPDPAHLDDLAGEEE